MLTVISNGSDLSVLIAASLTAISGQVALKSEERSAARRKPVAVGRAAATLGNSTCAEALAQLTIPTSWLWLKGFSSSYD